MSIAGGNKRIEHKVLILRHLIGEKIGFRREKKLYECHLRLESKKGLRGDRRATNRLGYGGTIILPLI